MLPSFLDIDTLISIIVISMVVTTIILILVVKDLDKPILRVMTILILAVSLMFMWAYKGTLVNCDNKNTQCKFFSFDVPQDGGFVQ